MLQVMMTVKLLDQQRLYPSLYKKQWQNIDLLPTDIGTKLAISKLRAAKH